jgi:hypothetical protein
LSSIKCTLLSFCLEEAERPYFSLGASGRQSFNQLIYTSNIYLLTVMP